MYLVILIISSLKFKFILHLKILFFYYFFDCYFLPFFKAFQLYGISLPKPCLVSLFSLFAFLYPILLCLGAIYQA